MKRLMLCLLLALLIGIFTGAPAHAAIEIKRINFNPDGRDTGTNSHLNREYVYLVNTGTRPVQLGGWKVFDRGRQHVYRFGRLYLTAGDTVRLRTGRGSDGAPACQVGEPCSDNSDYDMHWGLSEYVWGNNGDVATLINDNGNVVDRCRYGSAATNPKRC